jgi:UDP-N-acetylmuramoyl-L-alanyl-D-glutamate--2,6-diaminopimelate ligase
MTKKTFRIFFQKVKNYLWHYPKGLFYHLYYGQPSKKLTIIGVTGTDGKTTTTNLIHHCLQQSGVRTGMFSTVGAKIDNKEITLGLHTTSPDPSIVQRILKLMVNDGITHVVIEVTAHALDQFRFLGCHFKVAVITNTSHEHLDDFTTMSSYIHTKSKIFKTASLAILNKDDQSYKHILRHINTAVKTYSTTQPADYLATDIKLLPKHLKFKVGGYLFETNSPFQHQTYNILAAHAVLDSLKVPSSVIINAIKHFPEVKGRQEIVSNNLGIHCLVDFAHTPNALSSVLASLRKVTTGKLIVIFGATGGRDPSKRPIMGQVVSQIADIAIITADDTRNEKVENINSQIIAGVSPENKKFIYHSIPNRQDAFNLAVKLASKGDTIVACGKGHENTILHGKTEYPWSESEAFRTAFRHKKQT